MADKIIALGFGAPFGIAGRQPVSISLTRHLPFLGQYGKRIRTDEGMGGLSVEIFVDYCRRRHQLCRNLYIQLSDRCQWIIIVHFNHPETPISRQVP